MFGDLDQVLRLAERRGERLIDDDVTAGEQTLLGDRMMGCIRRRDDDEVDLAREQVIEAADEFDVGVARIGRTVPLYDRAEAQAVYRANDRRVKDLAREAEADQADVERRSALGLRDDAEVRLGRLPALGIDLLRVFVRHRAGDDDVVALLPVDRGRDLVLRRQLQ